MNSRPNPSSDEDRWAEVISEATQHVQTDGSDDEGSGAPSSFRRVFFGLLIGVSAALFTVQYMEPEPASLTVTSQAADLRIEAALLIEQIIAYWEERGTLPNPNALSPYLEEGYEYQIVDQSQGRFVVRRVAGGVTVTYDGSIPLNLWILLGGQTSGDGQ